MPLLIEADGRELDRLATLLVFAELMPAELRDLTALLQAVGDISAITKSEDLIKSKRGPLVRYLSANLRPARVSEWSSRLEKMAATHQDVSYMVCTAADYPARLRDAYDHPPLLFFRGELGTLQKPAVAIVGTRSPDDVTARAAHDTARQLSDYGYVVTSGLALGVDGAAHRGALQSGPSSTIAVLPCAFDAPVSPIEHFGLMNEILSSGLLVSQFPPGVPAVGSTFLHRNKVISGLSEASLVMAGRRHSGSSDEAESALRQGRSLFFWHQMAEERWAHELVEAGRASIVSSADDVVSKLGARETYD